MMTQASFPAPLLNVRNALVALHGAMLHAERVELERSEGRQRAMVFLDRTMHDPAYAWLHPYVALAARIDEAATQAARGAPFPPAELLLLWKSAEELLTIREHTTSGQRVRTLIQRDPAVALARRDLASAMMSAAPVM